jgi:hypothetical protein
MNTLAADMRAVPRVFEVSPPVPANDVRDWVRRQPWLIPAGLIGLWGLVGSGDIFETEEIFAPGGDPMYDIDVANHDLRSAGLSDEYLVFHSGLYLTAVDAGERFVRLDSRTLQPIGSFESIDAWYDDLRAQYGAKYGLPNT